MAITITTTYTFTTDDGTQYSDVVTEEIDQDNNAVAPMRYQCPVGTTREQVLDMSTSEEFGAADAGGINSLLIINRDDSNTVRIYVSNTGGDDYEFLIGPNEWHYLPTSQSELQIGSGFNDLSQIDASFSNQPGTIELLVFNNPGS